MKENIKKHLEIDKLRSLVSLHNLGMLIIVLVALSVSWTSTKIIQRNYNLLKKITILEQQVMIDEAGIANQKLMNEYYKTDTYLEIAARKQFNKALPGEKLMLIPKSLALQKVPSLAAMQSEDDNVATVKLQNWQKWIRFLTGRAIED